MKERPSLFKPEMVQAILEERKTKMRRVVNKLRGFGDVTEFGPSDTPGYEWHFRDKRMLWNDISHQRLMLASPYGHPGDRLWVRESHWRAELKGGGIGNGYLVFDEEWCHGLPRPTIQREYPGEKFGHISSIHMPRWASRLTLEITAVRVERVQDITEADAMAEGVFMAEDEPDLRWNPIQAFCHLWDSIHGNDGYEWNANPWVWVYTFKRVE